MPLDPNLRYPITAPPAEGELLEVAPDIFWLRLPLPFKLNHVHAWLLRDTHGWCLVDCGIGGQRMAHFWQHFLAEKLGGLPLTKLICTHYHPDHVGAAGLICQLTMPEFLMPEREWLYARMIALDINHSSRDEIARHHTRLGMPLEISDQLLVGGNGYAKGVFVPPAQLTPIRHGDVININGDAWQVRTSAGHAPEMATLYSPARKIFIASDQVLPNITPNVSVWAHHPTDDALGDFLSGLTALADIDDEALVLPSHGLPFYGLAQRVAYLKHHHDDRLAEIADLCRTPHTVYDLTRLLFPRELDNTQTAFAVGEVLAHCNYLHARGQLQRRNDRAWVFAS